MSKLRSKRYFFNVTDKELKDFKALADRRHSKLAEVIRQLLYRELDNEKKEIAA